MQRFEPIETADDARVSDYRDFRDPELRRRRGLFAVEGRESASVLLAQSSYRERMRSALLTRASLDALAPELPDDTRVFVAASSVIEKIAGVRFHQGCVLLVERPPALAPRELLARRPALVLGLEDVTDPDNVGGAFRNAFAFGVSAVLLSARSADPLYRKAIRTSIGATLRIPFSVAPDWPAALVAMGEAGLERVALTPDGDTSDVRALQPGTRTALLVGNEGQGLARSTLELAEARVRIPMAPGADSINVATAAAIALHQLRGKS